MKTYTEDQFREWAAPHGIGDDEKYPDSGDLSFNSDPRLNRLWIVPDEPIGWPGLLSLMLRLMGDWKTCRVRQRSGYWPRGSESERLNDRVEYQILSGLGLPEGTTDIVEFERSELDQLITLLFTTAVFGFCVGSDLHVIPDHGQHILLVSHHDEISVTFRRNKHLKRFVKEMAENGHPLPDYLPDETFKTPEWMEKGE